MPICLQLVCLMVTLPVPLFGCAHVLSSAVELRVPPLPANNFMASLVCPPAPPPFPAQVRLKPTCWPEHASQPPSQSCQQGCGRPQ
jgi:hypothetical protein